MPKDIAQVYEAGNYFSKRIATMATPVDKSTPAMAALFNTIPHGKVGRWRGPGKTLLFDVTCRLA